jgi:pimeloyl-ACP methyl ester carboxylesterase
MLKKVATMTDIYLPSWKVPVGPPTAEIAVAVVEPNDYKLKFEIKEVADPKPGEFRRAQLQFSAEFPSKDAAPPTPAMAAKGTLVLLHGIMMNKESLLVPWGLYFAEKGYRVVIVDLRGHGRSTGDWIGYGAWEAADLMKVADELQRRGLAGERIGVFGVSYGAALALHWAARDPRVATVVALAPYSDPRRAIGEFAKGVMPKLAGGISTEKFAAAENRAAQIAGFRWADTDVTAAVKEMHVPVLFFHGRYDDWIPPEHTAELMRLAPKGSRRALLPDNHLTLTLRLKPIGERAIAWFDAQLGATAPAVASAVPN